MTSNLFGDSVGQKLDGLQLSITYNLRQFGRIHNFLNVDVSMLWNVEMSLVKTSFTIIEKFWLLFFTKNWPKNLICPSWSQSKESLTLSLNNMGWQHCSETQYNTLDNNMEVCVRIIPTYMLMGKNWGKGAPTLKKSGDKKISAVLNKELSKIILKKIICFD